jgi:antitoxin ParD1/3/4
VDGGRQVKTSLPPELEKYIEEKMASGRYVVPSEVISEALRLLKDRDETDRCRLEALRQEIAIGLEQADRGEVAPLDIKGIKAEGRRRLTAI